jgi:hypothetical protein
MKPSRAKRKILKHKELVAEARAKAKAEIELQKFYAERTKNERIESSSREAAVFLYELSKL